MLLKSVLYSWRNWLLMLTVQVLVPLLLTSLSLTLLDLDESMGNMPLELSLKTYGQTIVPFYISPNSRLGPQLSQYFTDMLVAEEQIPLETVSKPGAQESSACCGGCGGCTLKSGEEPDVSKEHLPTARRQERGRVPRNAATLCLSGDDGRSKNETDKLPPVFDVS